MMMQNATTDTFARDAAMDDRMANPPRLPPEQRKAYARQDHELSKTLNRGPLQTAIRGIKKIYADVERGAVDKD
jgi:hypothetical protein